MSKVRYGVSRAAAGLVASLFFILGLEAPALAACTGTATATCDSAGNPYASGLTYNNTNQTLTLQDGVTINSGSNIGVFLQGDGVQTFNTGTDVSISNTGGNDAILIIGPDYSTPRASSIVIDAAGAKVTVNGTAAWGYDVWGTGNIQATVGDVTANGNGGVPVYMKTSGGDVSITTGNIKATGVNGGGYTVYGVYGVTTDNDATPGTVLIDTTGGTVSLTGTTNTGSGIYATGYGAVTVKAGGVSVAGNGALTTGIWASSFGSGATGKVSVDTTAGSVALTGTTSNFAGIFAGSSGGPVEVKTAGVSTKAANAPAVYAQTSGTGATGTINITTTGGLVKTEGAGAIGIYAQNSAASNAGLITINAGNVTTTGTGAAHGIQAGGPSNTATSGAVKITAGTITTAGSGANGINVKALGAIDASATKIVTTGDNAYGIQATGTGTADVKITAGDIDTGGVSTGAGAHGVNATGAGLVDVESIAGSKITTNGKSARGVNIDKLSGDVTVNVHSVETKGDNATGIHVYNGTLGGDGTGGEITVTANSVVTTGQTVKGNSNHYEVGNGADGIDVFNVGSGDAGKITIDTSVGATPGTLGTVNVSGRKSRGIVAVSGRLVDAGGDLPDIPTGGGAIKITTGDVTTTGDFGTAISATNWGQGADGAITINALGTVSASGANVFYPVGDVENEGNYQPNGISAHSWAGGDISITTKDVSSVGEAASAIYAQSGNGDLYAGIGKVTIDTTGGSVVAKGAGSSGITVGASSGEVKITTGNVTSEGDFGPAIQANNTGPNSAMTIDTTAGKVTAKGQSSAGISAGTGSASMANAGLLKILAGDVDVQGKFANGISAYAYSGMIEIEARGALTTGSLGGDGISVSSNGTTTAKVTVTSTGSIVTVADAADGIQLGGSGGTHSATVVIDGVVDAAGANAYGIISTGVNDEVTVDADGSVAGGKAGIRLQQLGAAKVTNKGEITGSGGTAVEFIGDYASTFDNDGTVTGKVLLGSGADTAIIGTNSSFSSTVDGEGGNDKLQFAGAGTATIDAAKFLNFETGEKVGASNWTLTGTNTSFVSTFDVSAGRLAVNGTLTNTAFTIADGAILGGNGSVGAVTVKSGGKLAPGNSIDTLTVASATYSAGSIYEVDVDPTSADLLQSLGTVTIDSAAQVSVLAASGAYVDGHRYLILDAVTRNGAFASTVVDNSAFLAFTLDQTIADQAWLQVATVANFIDVAETPNQMAAAGGLQERGAGNDLFDAIAVLDADSARRAFDLSSGEVHASVGGVLLDDSRFVREAVLDRMSVRFADAFGTSPLAYADDGRPAINPAGSVVGLWGNGFGSWGHAAGDGNAAGLDRSIGGFLGGIDVADAGFWRAGVAIGYQQSGVGVPDRNSSASVGGYNVAAYGALTQGPVALRFGGALTLQTVDTLRQDVFAGFDETLTAHYGARIAQAFGEVAYRRSFGGLGVEPFAGIAAISATTDGFTESGGIAALSSAPANRSITLASFGARFDADVHVGSTLLAFRGLAAWQHAMGVVTPTADLAFDGGTPFTIAGVPLARDTLRLQAGVDWQVTAGAVLGIAYSGQIASGVEDHGLSARLAVRF